MLPEPASGTDGRLRGLSAVLPVCAVPSSVFVALCILSIFVAMNVAFASFNSSQLRPLHWDGLEPKNSSRCSKQSLPSAEITDLVPRYFGVPIPKNR